MPTTDLSFIVDPGGSTGRPGINLQVFPSGDRPLTFTATTGASRSASGSLVAGGFADIQEFTFDTVLEGADFHRLNSLITWSETAKATLTPFEIVIYNLAQPYSELGPARTRYMVPGTTVISQVELDTSYYQWTYWIAVQGLLSIESIKQIGPCFETTLSFIEGTKLTQSLEP